MAILSDQLQRGWAQIERPRTSGRILKSEWAIMLLIATIHGIWSSLLLSDQWLVYDYWHYLGPEGLSSRELLGDHGGHWNLYNILLTNGVTETFGPRYWPAFGVVRAVAWAAVGVWAWWSTRRLGAEPLLALMAGTLVVTFGGDYWFKPWLLNIPLAQFGWVAISMIIGGRQTTRRRIGLLLVLLFGATVGSTIPLFAGGAFIYALLVKKMRYWLLPLGAGLAVFVTWSQLIVKANTTGVPTEWTFQKLASIPYLMLEVIAKAMARYTQLGLRAAFVICAIIGVLALYRFFSGRITTHEVLTLLYVAILAGAATVTRVIPGIASTGAVRYVAFVMPLIFGLIPAIRLPSSDTARRLSIAAAVCITLMLVNVNVEQSRNGYLFDRAASIQTEQLVNTTAFLIQNEIPFDPSQPLRGPGTGQLRIIQLVPLLDNGWVPEPIDSQLGPTHTLLLLKPVSDGAILESTCAGLADGGSVALDDFWLRGEPLGEVGLVWTSAVGQFQDLQDLDESGHLHFRTRHELGGRLTIAPDSTLQICAGTP